MKARWLLSSAFAALAVLAVAVPASAAPRPSRSPT